jgi:hypothetical protein
MCSPRIYTYKITFEEVPYYYYGMHEEKLYDEEYWGSPKTHKWCWDFYTPKKQILELFDTREEANHMEQRLIRPYYKDDENCLNENCGGQISKKYCRKGGTKTKTNKKGIFSRSKKDWIEHCKKNGNTTKQKGVGIFSLTTEQRSNNSKKFNMEQQKNKKGIYSYTKDERKEWSRKSGLKNLKNKTGIFSLTKDERIEISSKAGKIGSSQKWMCTVTGFISGAGPLTLYQNARNIDISNRIKLDNTI